MNQNSMSQITITLYVPENKEYFAKYLRGIYKYLEERDPFHKLAWNDNYTEFEVEDELKNLEKNHGEIFMAYDGNIVIGMVAISIPDKPQSVIKIHNPSIDGKIELLFVEEAYRKQGIGKILLEYGESILKNRGCDYVSLEVMPINDAYEIYKKHGYTDRSIAMLKKLI